MDVRFHHRTECDVLDVFCTIFLDFKKARPFHPSRVQNAFDFIIINPKSSSSPPRLENALVVFVLVVVCTFVNVKSAATFGGAALVKAPSFSSKCHPDVRETYLKNAQGKTLKEALAEDDECDALTRRIN